MTARIVFAIAVPLLIAGLAWVAPKVKARLSPTQDPASDETEGHGDREESGADPEYGDDLRAMKDNERELASIAEELDLDLLVPEYRAAAEEILALRLNVNELVLHFDERLEALLDDWQPGWWEETPVVPLESFAKLHALVDETGEFAVVA